MQGEKYPRVRKAIDGLALDNALEMIESLGL
jgi:hypothetical protein